MNHAGCSRSVQGFLLAPPDLSDPPSLDFGSYMDVCGFLFNLTLISLCSALVLVVGIVRLFNVLLRVWITDNRAGRTSFRVATLARTEWFRSDPVILFCCPGESNT